MVDKCMIVENEAAAAILRLNLPDDWMVISVGSAVTGHRFKYAVIACQIDLTDSKTKEWLDHVLSCIVRGTVLGLPKDYHWGDM